MTEPVRDEGLKPVELPPYTKRGIRSSRYATGDPAKMGEGIDYPGVVVNFPGPPQVPKDGRIWHYTNTAGLHGILESGTLWATDVRLLNDSSELQHGLELFKRALQSVVERRPDLDSHQLSYLDTIHTAVVQTLNDSDVYVTCASKNGDDLGQWRGYSGGGGYSIALNPHAGLGVQTESQSDLLPLQDKSLMIEWREVVYDAAKKEALLAEVVDFIAASTPDPDRPEDASPLRDAQVVTTALETITRLKHDGFEAEQEVRLVVTGERLRPYTSFRPGAFGITGYLRMTRMPDLMAHGHILVAGPKLFELPIEEITVGPAQDQDTAASAVRAFLRAKGKESEIRVGLGTIPYRLSAS